MIWQYNVFQFDLSKINHSTSSTTGLSFYHRTGEETKLSPPLLVGWQLTPQLHGGWKRQFTVFFYYIQQECGTIWNWTIIQRFGHLHNIRELGCFSFLFFLLFLSLFPSLESSSLKKSQAPKLQIYSESNLEYLHWFTLPCAKQKCPLNIVCKKAKMHQGWNQPTVSLQSEKQFSKVWLSSHISFTKEHFQPSDSGKLYTSWPLFFFLLLLLLFSFF